MARISNQFEEIAEFIYTYMENNNFTEEAVNYKAEINILINRAESDNNLTCYISVINTIQGVLFLDYTISKCVIVACSERAMMDLLRCIPMNQEFSFYFDEVFRKLVSEYLNHTFDISKAFYIKGMRVSDLNNVNIRRDFSKEVLINSKKNEIVSEFKRYTMLNERINSEKFVVEGMLLVDRALRDGLQVEKVVYCDSLEEEKVSNIVEVCKSNKIAYYRVSSGIMATMTTTHPTPQVICSVRIRMLHQNDLIILNNQNIFLILDGIANPDNLGMVIRTADAAGISAVILLSNSTHFMNKNVIRGARGAVGRIPIYFSTNDDELFEKLKVNNFRIFGTSARFEASNFFDIDYSNKNNAIVIGNESNGVRKEILDKCTDYVKIPMAEGQSSLNIAVASALMMYEFNRMLVGLRKE